MNRKEINLIIPRSWNECSTEQLEQLSALAIARNVASQLGQPEETSEREYRFRAFLMLAGLKQECRTTIEDGEATYHFPLIRSTWWKRMFCRTLWIPVQPWMVKEWTDKHLKWLDEPYGRLKAPYEYVKVRTGLFKHTRLKCLDMKMYDCTYRQYVNLENILKQYWATQELAEKLRKDLVPTLSLDKSINSIPHTITPALQHQLDNIDRLRRMFMATILSPGVHIKEQEKGGKVITVSEVTYRYDEAQLEQYMDKFSSRQVERMFPVLLQFYLSVQRYFSTLYPNLYVHRDNEGPMKVPDFMRMEIESMSTIMKYQNFNSYREVYESEAVHILQVLDNMARESKEVKRMNNSKS